MVIFSHFFDYILGSLLRCTCKVYSYCVSYISMVKQAKKNTIERVVIKIPKEVADYFRCAFPHGKRSEFVARCILDHKHDHEVKKMEKVLLEGAKKRQNID